MVLAPSTQQYVYWSPFHVQVFAPCASGSQVMQDLRLASFPEPTCWAGGPREQFSLLSYVMLALQSSGTLTGLHPLSVGLPM